MATFNSNKASSKKFNSLRYSASSKNPLKLLFGRGSTGLSMHNHDPEYTFTRARANSVADHYLNGCNCNDKSGCGGSYRDHGLTEPSDDAINILGLYKQGNTWKSDPRANRLGRVRTLADHLATPVIPKEFANHPGVAQNLRFEDYHLNPLIHIGYDNNRQPILSGHYNYGKNDEFQHFAHPYNDLQTIKSIRDLGVSKLMFDQHSTNLRDYFDLAKGINHLAHGEKIVDPRDGKVGGFVGLEEGAEPLRYHVKQASVLRSQAHNTIPNLRFAKNRDQAEIIKDAHESAKTAEFTNCHCVPCMIDRWNTGANQVFDVQDHKRAARSKDPALREAYWGDRGFHVNKVQLPGDDGMVRLSDLGPQGKLTPHRNFWPTQLHQNFVNHVVQGLKDRQHVGYQGSHVILPAGVPQFNKEMMSNLSGVDLFTELPSAFDD